MSLVAGDLAPDFTMTATGAATGGRSVSLVGQRGRPFVLYFYPRADTPGCTVEACGFQEALPALEGIGVAVIGVSRDSLKALKKFAAKFSLSCPLASDPGGVAEAYGVWVEKSMYGKTYMGLERATFLIDGAATIVRVWRKVKIAGHVEEVKQEAAVLRR